MTTTTNRPRWIRRHRWALSVALWAAVGVTVLIAAVHVDSWEEAGDVALMAAAVSTSGFVIIYPLLAKIRSEIGWQMLAFRIFLAAVLDYILLVNLGVLAGDDRYLPRPFIYGGIALGTVWLTSILIRAQLNGRRCRHHHADADTGMDHRGNAS